MNIIGERIKQARKAAKLTQAQLAEKSGTATITIHQYESGKRKPRTEQLQAIAAALGVSVDSLLSEEKEIAPNLIRTITDNPDSPYFVYDFSSTDPENIASLVDTLSSEGTYQHLLMDAFGHLNSVGQHIAVQLVQQLSTISEFHIETNQKEDSTDGLDT